MIRARALLEFLLQLPAPSAMGMLFYSEPASRHLGWHSVNSGWLELELEALLDGEMDCDGKDELAA